MSTDRTIGVRLPVTEELRGLLADVEAAGRRAAKSDPGERTEIVGYESLCSSLEAQAATRLAEDPGSIAPVPATEMVPFVRSGAEVVVLLHLPLEPGEFIRSTRGITAPEPTASVEVRDDIRGRQLVEERFRAQLEAAVNATGQDRSSALSPSGIHNRVLTEVLRQYVDRQGGQPVDVPVVYRDGSPAGAAFRFRCLDLVDELRDSSTLDLNLRLTLLSIRHTEMDPVVDGAWLRNAEVSRPRTGAQTDDFVYQTSVTQLRALTADGALKVRLHIFQTGMETAVVGFFRAVSEFLEQHPGRLEVVPMFYSARPNASSTLESEFAGFEPGQTWATRS